MEDEIEDLEWKGESDKQMVLERTSDALDSFWNSPAKATASIVACRLELRGGIYEDACIAAMMLEASCQ